MRASLFLRFRAFSLCTSSVTHCRLKAASCLCWSISCSRYSSSRLCDNTQQYIHVYTWHRYTVIQVGRSISCSSYSSSQLCGVTHSSTHTWHKYPVIQVGLSIAPGRYSSSWLCGGNTQQYIHLTGVHSDTGGSINCSRYSSPRLCGVTHSNTYTWHKYTGGSISCSRYSSCWPPSCHTHTHTNNHNNNKNDKPTKHSKYVSKEGCSLVRSSKYLKEKVHEK